MLKRFREQLDILGYSGQQILVAASGGIDSQVLLDLLLKSGCRVALAHANFQLRGEESDGDETFVRQRAASLNIPVHVKRFDTNNYAIENGLSIQMAARALRYDWFETLLTQEKIGFLATAHHLNDQLETSLLNFARGTGLAGIRGIPQTNGKIIRPLLIFLKSEIEAYARKENILWRDDSSNERDDYQRNFIRHQVIPMLKQLNTSLEETYYRTSRRLAAAEELAASGLEALMGKYLSEENGEIRILKTLWVGLKHPAPVLFEIIKTYGFNLSQCDSIIAASQGQPGKIFLSDRFQLVVDREALLISAFSEPSGEVIIETGQREAKLGVWQISRQDNQPGVQNNGRGSAQLDLEKLKFPLIWRGWRAGDFFHPLGMVHRKKISDFLNDRKISGKEKSEVTVLVSAGEIVWVVGYRIDDRYKITPGTFNVLHLMAEHQKEQNPSSKIL